jgi:hypothetical protein
MKRLEAIARLPHYRGSTAEARATSPPLPAAPPAARPVTPSMLPSMLPSRGQVRGGPAAARTGCTGPPAAPA